MKTVLHITAHMGGGVGRILSSISKNGMEFNHRFILLEEPEKKNFLNDCINNSVKVFINPSKEILEYELENCDIVQLEWWNHPVMSKLLYDFPQIKTRLIIWSHISGCSYPNIPVDFIKIPSKFLFTSEYSYENPTWSLIEQNWVKDNVSVVNSAGSLESFKDKELKAHVGFNIGYIGTLSYSKLNPKIYDFYNSIDIQDFKAVMIGDINKDIVENTNNLNKELKQKIIFKDYVTDVSKELEYFDIFSYILNEEHFGTTENILLEAMAIGLPVIALNQCAEKHIIKNNKTGILVNNINEYVEAVRFLHDHPRERNRLGQEARKFVFENYDIENTVKKLDMVYLEIMKHDKKVYKFKDIMGKFPHDWFLNFTGRYKDIFDEDNFSEYIPYIFLEKNKSSIEHFYRYFREDNILKKWYEDISHHNKLD